MAFTDSLNAQLAIETEAADYAESLYQALLGSVNTAFDNSSREAVLEDLRALARLDLLDSQAAIERLGLEFSQLGADALNNDLRITRRQLDAAVSINGKLVRLEQPYQAPETIATDEVLSNGKLVRLEQLCQLLVKFTAAEVLINGKLVRLEQPYQALVKFVPDEVFSSGKLVRLEQPSQAARKLVPLEVSIKGKLVSPEQLIQAF